MQLQPKTMETVFLRLVRQLVTCFGFKLTSRESYQLLLALRSGHILQHLIHSNPLAVAIGPALQHLPICAACCCLCLRDVI